MSTMVVERPKRISLEWLSRATITDSAMGPKKTWRTKCRHFEVTTFTEISGLKGGDFTAWRVGTHPDGTEARVMISRHYSMPAAKKACERSAKENPPS